MEKFCSRMKYIHYKYMHTYVINQQKESGWSPLDYVIGIKETFLQNWTIRLVPKLKAHKQKQQQQNGTVIFSNLSLSLIFRNKPMVKWKNDDQCLESDKLLLIFRH